MKFGLFESLPSRPRSRGRIAKHCSGQSFHGHLPHCLQSNGPYQDPKGKERPVRPSQGYECGPMVQEEQGFQTIPCTRVHKRRRLAETAFLQLARTCWRHPVSSVRDKAGWRDCLPQRRRAGDVGGRLVDSLKEG